MATPPSLTERDVVTLRVRTQAEFFARAQPGLAKAAHSAHSARLISLRAYRQLEDAWTGGVADWCRAATPLVLGGGRAWMVTVSEGQTNWIKQRLLAEGTSLFGVQFLSARALRRELCLRAGLPPLALGVETLRLLLRLHALAAATPGAEWSGVARHPEACLSALDDFAGAVWLDDIGLIDTVLPRGIGEWLPKLRATGSWTPDIDRRLADCFAADRSRMDSLSVCVFGWDADAWSRFDLLTATVRAAGSAHLYLPLPGGPSETLRQAWLDACEAAFGVERTDCAESGFVSAQAALAERLEGADFAEIAPALPAPELLTGVDSADTVTLVRDYVARWLADELAEDLTGSNGCHRLAIICSGRGGSSVSLVRALTDAKIAVEDELGEVPQPSLDVQIERAIVEYHLNHADLASLLALVDLLNEHAAVCEDSARVLREVFPLDAVEVRRALRGAFAEGQHHSARLLSETVSFERTPVAKSVRCLIDHLGAWPEALPWDEALERWQQTLAGLGLSTSALEPLWSRLGSLMISNPVPAEAFFHYVAEILGGVQPRREPEASHRFARVVVTTLAGAVGQIWGGVVWLDANEGAWPLYPSENPFLDDDARRALNARREESVAHGRTDFRGHLLTASDHAQLEHSHFLDVLGNCRGPLAFASSSRAADDPGKELHPNEWLLRCLAEVGPTTGTDGGKLLDRWRRSTRRTSRELSPLVTNEQKHLREIWTARRDPGAPFDEYFFNFLALTDPEELPWGEAWSAGELDAAWNRPASFALDQIFDAQTWHDDHGLVRDESWLVGRLVHRWLPVALAATCEPRRLRDDDWVRAMTVGLARARAETEDGLRARLRSTGLLQPPEAATMTSLPLWWQGVLRRATWATCRCLESLSEIAAKQGDGPIWLALNQSFSAGLPTAVGPLRVRARCDVVLLDRPGLEGAVCQLIDIRTGAAPAHAASSASQLAHGKGLHAVATLLLAVAAGADSAQSRAGTIHPDASDVSLTASAIGSLAQPALEILARQQRALVFGQKGPLVDAHNPGHAEILPLATTPIEPATLAAKARRTEL